MSTGFAGEYAGILQEYDALMREMVDNRQGMLAAITAGNLEAVQLAMNTAQADTMRMEKMEARRLAAQAKNGFENSSIGQVVQQLAPAEKNPLLPLLGSITHQAEELHFLAEKAMGMAQCNLVEMDPRLLEDTLQKTQDGTPASSYEKQRHTEGEKPIIETKA